MTGSSADEPLETPVTSESATDSAGVTDQRSEREVERDFARVGSRARLGLDGESSTLDRFEARGVQMGDCSAGIMLNKTGSRLNAMGTYPVEI